MGEIPDVGQAIAAKDLALAQYLVGRSLQAKEPVVKPEILNGESVMECAVEGLNLDLKLVLLTYRTKVYRLGAGADNQFGFAMPISAFCAQVRNGYLSVLQPQISVATKGS